MTRAGRERKRIGYAVTRVSSHDTDAHGLCCTRDHLAHLYGSGDVVGEGEHTGSYRALPGSADGAAQISPLSYVAFDTHLLSTDTLDIFELDHCNLIHVLHADGPRDALRTCSSNPPAPLCDPSCPLQEQRRRRCLDLKCKSTIRLDGHDGWCEHSWFKVGRLLVELLCKVHCFDCWCEKERMTASGEQLSDLIRLALSTGRHHTHLLWLQALDRQGVGRRPCRLQRAA